MRSFDEIGKFVGCSDEVNEAYATYASTYLDCVDDNIHRFLEREIDTRPIEDLGPNDGDSAWIKAFLDAAAEIVKQTLDSITDGNEREFSLSCVLREYPLLESRLV